MSRALRLTAASTVRARRPRWLLEDRLPLGSVSLLAGDPGLGKSTWALELAARASVGELPGDLLHMPCAALYASAEDSAETTLVPRLMAAGADLSRVHFVSMRVGDAEGERPDSLTLPEDVLALVDAAEGVGARVIVLDPVVAYLSEQVNSHRDQQVRRVLAPFAEHAARLDLVVLALLHLNKTQGGTALNRIGGSVGFGGAARSALLLARDPDDPDGDRGSKRVVAHLKCNVGPLAASLAGRIEPREVTTPDGLAKTSRWVTMGVSDHEAADLLDPNGETLSARDEAVDFLRSELASGSVAAKTITARAADAGIALRTLERAKKKLGARSARGSDGAWSWSLPPNNPPGGLGGVGGLEWGKAAKAAKFANDNGEQS